MRRARPPIAVPVPALDERQLTPGDVLPLEERQRPSVKRPPTRAEALAVMFDAALEDGTYDDAFVERVARAVPQMRIVWLVGRGGRYLAHNPATGAALCRMEWHWRADRWRCTIHTAGTGTSRCSHHDVPASEWTSELERDAAHAWLRSEMRKLRWFLV